MGRHELSELGDDDLCGRAGINDKQCSSVRKCCSAGTCVGQKNATFMNVSVQSSPPPIPKSCLVRYGNPAVQGHHARCCNQLCAVREN